MSSPPLAWPAERSLIGNDPEAGGTTVAAERAVRVETELVDDLYRRAAVALLGFAIALAILGHLVLEQGGATVRAAVSVLAGLIVVRMALVVGDRSGRGPFVSTRSREAAFLTGIGLTSIALAALNIAAYPTLTPAQSALLGACQTGAIAGGLASLGSSSRAFALYAVPNLGALMVMVALDHRGWGERTFLLLLCAYLPAVLLVSVQQSRVRRRTAELEIELRELALRDPLTGLFNRRFGAVLLDKESAVAQNSCHMQNRRKPMTASVLGLLMVDIDHFKAINDGHGHAAGDAVLRQIGAVLKSSLRPCDEVLRWGGEEFVVVLRLPWEDRERVSLVAGRLLSAIRGRMFQFGGGELRCTASIGFALHPLSDKLPNLLPWDATLQLADSALYLAKNEGRDRVVGAVAGPALEARSAEAPALFASGLGSAAQAGLLRVMRGEVGRGGQFHGDIRGI
jgi:diguanylate cyclase (GGDEF)-like protein